KKIIIYLLDQKRYAEVVPYYNDLIKAEPTRYDYRLDLIKIYYLIGDLDSAVEQLNIINSQSPETLKDYQDFVNEIYDAYNKPKFK
ncbi:MAG: tetratricopeptide repeat protein, partial [Patescibacteria group bacterium]